MPQFFIRSSDIVDNTCRIQGEDFRHLVTVRRARPGDVLQLRDERSIFFMAKITGVFDTFIEATILEERRPARLPADVTLYLCLLKGGMLEDVIEKSVEIGVSRIIPVVSERTVPHPHDTDAKLVRWNRKAAEAAKQSLRERIPVVERIHTFKDAVDSDKNRLRIVAHPDATAFLKDVLHDMGAGPVSLLVGPEGGLSAREIEIATSAGWNAARIGFSHMRAGTAAVVLCGILIYEFGNTAMTYQATADKERYE